MKRMIVIGIGSLIMTDDGIGARVASALEGQLREHAITVLVGETDTQYCLDEIRPDDFLVVIDAVMDGREPGSIETVSLQDAIKGREGLRSQHDYNLIDAVSLNYPHMAGCFIGIEAKEIGFGFELSDVLKERFVDICHNVRRALIAIKEAEKHA